MTGFCNHRGVASPPRVIGGVLRLGLVGALVFLGVYGAVPRVAPAASGRLVVRVLPNAEVFGEASTLGEIAELDGFDLPMLRKLAGIAIAASPRPGQSIVIGEGMIRSRLAGWDGPHIDLSVPPQARVERAGRLVAGAEIARIVLERSGSENPRRGDAEVRQRVVGELHDVMVPKGRLEWETELQGTHLVEGGNRTYQVTARVDGKQAWRSLVRVRQKVYEEILVANTPIRRGQVIREEHLAQVRKNISNNLGDPFLTNARQAVGKRALRPIGRGEPLRAGMVKGPAAVTEGGRVFVVYRGQGLKLSVPGVALVEGKVGQFIPVRNLSSGKIVHGILEAGQQVRVN